VKTFPEFPDKTLVKVHARSQRTRICKRCGQPVDWFKTVNRERMMLFNGGARPLKTGSDPATGDPVLYLDRGDCHWERCPSQLSPA
jgi:hypothetical protein